VDRGDPFTWTTEAVTNLSPVTVRVAGVVVPAASVDGLTWMAPTGGLLIATWAAAEVPPPGGGFTAVSERFPVADTSAAARVTFTWVALVKVVVRALPFTSITVEGVKPVPLTAITGEEVPITSVAGLTAVIAGVGFDATIASVAGGEVPPPGAGFMAVKERLATADTSAAVSVRLTWLPLMNVVVRAVPLTSMTVVGTNRVPVTVSNVEVEPIVSLAGENDAMVGAGLSTSSLM